MDAIGAAVLQGKGRVVEADLARCREEPHEAVCDPDFPLPGETADPEDLPRGEVEVHAAHRLTRHLHT